MGAGSRARAGAGKRVRARMKTARRPRVARRLVFIIFMVVGFGGNGKRGNK